MALSLETSSQHHRHGWAVVHGPESLESLKRATVGFTTGMSEKKICAKGLGRSQRSYRSLRQGHRWVFRSPTGDLDALLLRPSAILSTHMPHQLSSLRVPSSSPCALGLTPDHLPASTDRLLFTCGKSARSAQLGVVVLGKATVVRAASR